MKIVFLDRETLSPQTVLRAPNFKHEFQFYNRTSPDEVIARIHDAHIVVTNKVQLSAAAIQAAAHLKLIAISATGVDNVDLSACRASGVTVSNIRDYAKHTVPEHTFSLIFALRRSLFAYRDAVKSGRWQAAQQFCFFDYPIHDLAGSTIGIIGDGALGQAVAAIARAFNMRVLFSGYKGRTGQGSLYTPFEETLTRSDIISLHCPLNAETRNMIGAREFAAMARKPLLINTARGGLVDENAVGPALCSGQISGAAFDVASTEPPPLAHPFMSLLARPDFILTPHVAWASNEAVQSLADQLIANIEAFVRGAPVNTL